MKIKINKSTVAKIQPPVKGYSLVWDNELSGFGVRVTQAGVRSFILQKRVRGAERRITLGRYPGVSAEVARREAIKLLGTIASGGDPLADKERVKLKAITLEQAFNDYIRVRELKPNTILGIKAELENTFGKWRDKPLLQITRRMVEKRYLERCDESKARANVAMRYLRAVFNLAISEYRDSEDEPIIASNPVAVLSESKIWRKVERRRTVLRPTDLQTWVPVVKALGDTPSRPDGLGRFYPRLRNGSVQGDVFLFAAMTGCRKSEVLGLRKQDVDFSRGIVTFRDTKNLSHHELPLTVTLSDILKVRMAESPIDYVFASKHEAAVPSNFRSSYARVKDQTGLLFTLHDLRRLAATSMERLGVPGYTIKAILNHKTGTQDVTGGYVQVDLEMMLLALRKLEVFINNCGSNGQNVVSIETQVA